MDKNAIKRYAVWARNELIERVTQKAEQFEITAEADPNADAVRGVLLTKDEKEQRKKLISKVKEKGFDQVMEEVAYTWFNRFSALRFMEVNNYLPSRVRVFTDADGAFKPQILTEAIHLDLEGLDMEKVYALKEANDNDALFKYLIITQCNALSKVLPGMFQKIADYTELLFPDNLLREGSVIEKMISDIPEDNWDVSEGGQVEILGWLYQYYISEKHESVVDPLHGKVVAKDEVPAATALFTTDWVVRYLIDNSVGRYWIERNPDSKLKDELEYFVTPKDGKIPTVNEKITPDQLTVFDPSMGSAHFGVYAFEVLEKIYTEYGYTEREAAASIVENNLFGLDIDDRSAQIAYFAIMMKAMQYDKRFLKRGIQPHFYSIQESNDIDSFAVDYFAKDNVKLKHDIQSIIDDFKDAKEYGSIIQITPVDFDALFARFDEIKTGADINIYTQIILDQILPIVNIAKIMSNRYTIVATNPPYLNKFDAKLKQYVIDNYKDYSGDLFSVFIFRNFGYCKPGGYSGFMTPYVWMFIKSYEKLRSFLISSKSITTLIQFEYSAFEEATVPICSFVLQNKKSESKGCYIRLASFTGGMETQRRKMLEAQKDKNCGYYYETDQQDYWAIDGAPIAFWASKKTIEIFKTSSKIGDVATASVGIQAGDNNKFLHLWWEVDWNNINRSAKAMEDSYQEKKWFPYNKGGEYRKWYGNDYFVIDWKNDGKNIKDNSIATGHHYQQYSDNLKFKPLVTWSRITSGTPAFRIKDYGFLSDMAGFSLYSDNETLKLIEAFCNSVVARYFLSFLSPTLNIMVGQVNSMPLLDVGVYKEEIISILDSIIEISKIDWDAYETSWDFKKNPLINGEHSVEAAYEKWSVECDKRFNALRLKEEKLNDLYIKIYGLDGELDKTVEEKDITVRKADKTEAVKNLISYAVGCMFGRYSLDTDGIIFAGGHLDKALYKSFQIDADGIIPICDDEYFDDDITGLFVKFIDIVYGSETLEDNLKFIATALHGEGSPREVIRNYFLNDFYSDHCSMYSVTGAGRRPIYWLFDSGKKNGFKCLIYLHRYQPDTIARIRTDYVHEQQARYRTAIEGLEREVKDSSASERIKKNNQLKKLKGQAEELKKYEEKIHHLADQMITIDLDDGVKSNYELFKDVLAKLK